MNEITKVTATSADRRPRRHRPSLVTVRDKIERALRNGQGAHFNLNEVRALVEAQVFEFICNQASKEIAKCLDEVSNRAFKPDHSGSNGATSEEYGKSPGMIGVAMDESAASAASRRAARTVARVMGPQKKR